MRKKKEMFLKEGKEMVMDQHLLKKALDVILYVFVKMSQ